MIIDDNQLEDGELGTAGESALQRISAVEGRLPRGIGVER
jgi:hypothetical protein